MYSLGVTGLMSFPLFHIKNLLIFLEKNACILKGFFSQI